MTTTTPKTVLSENTNHKFVESFNTDEWEVLGENGYVSIISSNKTIEYEVLTLTFDDGSIIECADTHILIDADGNEVYAKNSLDKSIKSNSEDGFLVCIDIKYSDKYEHMYDLSVDSTDHTYYTNNVLSHNTTTLVAYALWYTLFNGQKYVAILANKGDTAREILGRFTLALENIPFFLQPGCRVLNKGSIEFSNNTKIVARATSASSIRGASCVISSTLVCVIDDYGNIYYTTIDRVNDINNNVVSMSINAKYEVSYEMTNKFTGKVYKVENHLTNDLNDGHIGNSIEFQKDVENFGPENFDKKITKIREL